MVLSGCVLTFRITIKVAILDFRQVRHAFLNKIFVSIVVESAPQHSRQRHKKQNDIEQNDMEQNDTEQNDSPNYNIRPDGIYNHNKIVVQSVE
jgi:hypothetical protein